MRDIAQRITLARDLATDGWYKEAVAHLVPARLFVTIFNRWYARESRVWRDSRGWWIGDKREEIAIALPRAMTAARFSKRTIRERLQDVRTKYELDGFVQLEEEDVVVDIGAFIGEFTLAAAGHSTHIVAFEPDPLTYAVLERTAEAYENVRAENTLLWNERGRIGFSVATDGSESSVFEPNRGSTSFRHERTAERFDDVVDVDVDFVKVEAEGAEAEVIEGFGDSKVSKIAVDCSEPNPNTGITPEGRVRSILERRGYETEIVEKETEGTMLFARVASD